MTKFSFFAIILLLSLGCSEKKQEKTVIDPAPKKEKKEKFIFGHRYEIVGDFDGDGVQEKLIEHYFDALIDMEVPKFIEGMDDAERTTKISPFSFMLSDNPEIDTMRIATGPQVSGVLFMKNEGDLNGDNSDEISFVVHWADWSSGNRMNIVTYRNNKWEKLLVFKISEHQLERLTEKNSGLVKKVGEKKIEFTFSNYGVDEQTKIETFE